MASNSSRSVALLTLFVFAMAFSPFLLPCEAARFTGNGLSGVMRVLLTAPSPPIIFCPACACCAPAPPGRCCPCICPSPSPPPPAPLGY